MKRFKNWDGYLKGWDEETPQRIKIEDIANEVAELLINKSLSCSEVGQVLRATQAFVNQCKFNWPG